MMKLGEFIQRFTRTTREIEHGVSIRQVAQAVRDDAKAAIGTYRYGWPPLSPKTIAKKGSDTPLLVSGKFRESIEMSVSADEKKARVGTNDPKAEMFEYGTRKMPPRPVIRPAVRAVKGALGTVTEQVKAHFRNNF